VETGDTVCRSRLSVVFGNVCRGLRKYGALISIVGVLGEDLSVRTSFGLTCCRQRI